jgi:hypothetical protein
LSIKRLRDPYLIFCAVAIFIWLAAWLAATPNLYGWLVDDADTFSRFQLYAQGGQHYFDIQWFHAYMWFVAFLPLLFHWTLPSHIAPRVWEAMPEFRAFIVYTIVLHAIVLGMLACFFTQLCSNRWICAGAFLLILTSPTLTLYTPLLDSRYLGFLAALPAMMLLLQAAKHAYKRISVRDGFVYYFIPGLLIAIGSDIHYECLYFAIPFSIVYWLIVIMDVPRAKTSWIALLAFVLGLTAWLLPVQLLSMLFHPFATSYIGTLLAQYSAQIVRPATTVGTLYAPSAAPIVRPYTRLENLATWFSLYVSEMGIPLMLAVVAGGCLTGLKRFRPPYISRFSALLMVFSTLLFSAYLVYSQTFPFYRMSFGFQFFYALFALVLVERFVSTVFRKPSFASRAGALVLLGAIAWIPSVVLSPEVFAAQQGYGKAVNLAYGSAGSAHVNFINTFDTDSRPFAITSREQFNEMSSADYLVTYFPLSFHFKYPDLFALLYDVTPVASYPTLWCTREMWAQVPSFYGGRRWMDEPPNCEAQVFRVADIRKALQGPRLEIRSVDADSSALPYLDARRVFALREPSSGWSGSDLWNPYWDLWVSRATGGRHWLDVHFAKPASIGRVTIVPPDFRVPPDFLWHGRKRVENVQVYGSTTGEPLRLLWSGSELQDKVIFDATFPAQELSSMRFVMSQGPGENPAVGIKYIRFPGFEQTTSWQNDDPPGRPPPAY